MARALIGLGSNIEPRREYLGQALRALAGAPFMLLKASQVFETEPMDLAEQGPFLNMAASLECQLDARGLLRALQAIELQAGKKITLRRGPRTLDLDLWDYDGLCMDDPELTLPHPRMAERPFVLHPLAEIAPEWRHPLNGLTAAEMLAALPGPGAWVRPLGPLP